MCIRDSSRTVPHANRTTRSPRTTCSSNARPPDSAAVQGLCCDVFDGFLEEAPEHRGMVADVCSYLGYGGQPTGPASEAAEPGVIVAESAAVFLVCLARLVVFGGVLDLVLGAVDVDGLVFVVDALDHARGQHHRLAQDPWPCADQQIAAPGLAVVLVDLPDVPVDGVNRVAVDVSGIQQAGAKCPNLDRSPSHTNPPIEPGSHSPHTASRAACCRASVAALTSGRRLRKGFPRLLGANACLPSAAGRRTVRGVKQVGPRRRSARARGTEGC